MPSAPCACAATSAPYSAASSTAARICSSVSSGAPGTPPRGHHRTGRDQLDQVGAAVEHPPHGAAHLVDGVDDPHPQLVRHDGVDVRRQAGDVAAAAGAGDVRAGDPHPRPDHPAGVDRVAQRDVDERAERADVADGGEAGQHGVAGVADAGQRLLRAGAGEQLGVAVAAVRLADQVGVAVDHARQQRVPGQVDDAGALGGRVGGATTSAMRSPSTTRPRSCSSSPLTTSRSRCGRRTVRGEVVTRAPSSGLPTGQSSSAASGILPG